MAHHRRPRIDDAEVFKRKSLSSIDRRKKLARLSFIALSVTAAMLMALVVLAYFIG